MDLFFLTSIKEGLPYVLIEAQTNGLKCIVSDSIDKSSDISNSIIFISLKEPINNWIEIIKKEKFKRKDNVKSIIESGYSIEDSVKIINKLYKK